MRGLTRLMFGAILALTLGAGPQTQAWAAPAHTPPAPPMEGTAAHQQVQPAVPQAPPAPQVPAVPPPPVAPVAPPEVLLEVRVHGNFATSDATILAIARLVIGQPLPADIVEAVEARLRASRRFEEVEVRKRYRSLTETDQVVLVIVVREFPTSEEEAMAGMPGVPAPPGRHRFGTGMMFLPMLDYADGYGFTYGGRFTFMDVLGRNGRASVPLTWGGTKRAALELDKELGRGPFDRLAATASISRRENPYYDLDDDRNEVSVAASRALARNLHLGLFAGYTDLSFGDLDDRFASYGATLTLDTRLEPAFPRNAVLASVGWEGADFPDGPTINRYRVEGHGYLGLIGSTVLAVGARYERPDRPLPPYLQPLLGGADTLRGFRAGAFAGDNLLVASAELRVPFTTPLSFARTGVAVFADAGTVYPHGVALHDVTFERGFGAGLFLAMPVLNMRLDVAHGVGAGTRGHFTLGVRF